MKDHKKGNRPKAGPGGKVFTAYCSSMTGEFDIIPVEGVEVLQTFRHFGEVFGVHRWIGFDQQPVKGLFVVSHLGVGCKVGDPVRTKQAAIKAAKAAMNAAGKEKVARCIAIGIRKVKARAK